MTSRAIAFLANKKITVVLLLALIPLAVLEGQRRNVPGAVFIAFAVPLVLNLCCCLLNHLKARRSLTVERAGFLLFHVAFLMIIAGGIISYFTYSIGYVEVVEGEGFRDERENYTEWKQKFGTRRGSGAAITVKRINLDFWDNGQIRSYDNIISIRDGAAEREAVLGVNGSVQHGWLLINLARYYGLAPRFTVAVPEGESAGYVYISDVTKASTFTIPLVGRKATVSYGKLGDRALDLTVDLGGGRTITRRIAPGDFVDLGNGSLKLTGIRLWNGLTVVRDMGKWPTYAGFAFFLLGLAMYYRRTFFGRDK